MAVDLDDRVVDIDQRVLLGSLTAAVTVVGGGSGAKRLGEPAQREQKSGGDRVELPDVPERERSQERPQSRGRVRVGENAAHPAMAEQAHVVDRVRTRGHPGDQRGDLQPGVRALVGGHRQMLIGQLTQPCCVSQRKRWEQTSRRHQIRVVELRGSGCER